MHSPAEARGESLVDGNAAVFDEVGEELNNFVARERGTTMMARSVQGIMLGIAAVLVVSASGASGTPLPVDVTAAIRAWEVKATSQETTGAFHRRIAQQIINLSKKPTNQLEDTEKWRLLAYVRELPWKRVPSSWKTWYLATMPNPRLTEEQTSALLERIQSKKLYEVTPKELDVYLGWAQKAIPDLRQRVVHYARQRVGQPYEMYLLGEFPFEIYDPQPLFELSKSDCVVFCEHTYAMALSSDWKEFFATLQKIRYKNGQIGMLTRNHYTEADWNKNNSWLVQDVTTQLGATSVSLYTERIDRNKFFAKYGLDPRLPMENLVDHYIPGEAVASVVGKLKDGDFVNVVRGKGQDAWVGHTGLIAHDGKGQVVFIHSTPPKVVEVPLLTYVRENLEANAKRAKKNEAQFLGLKFLRLRAEELSRSK